MGYLFFKRLGSHLGDGNQFFYSSFKLILATSATSVKEEIDLSHKNEATTSTHRAGDSESRSLELRFSNSIIPTLMTGDDLQAIGGVPLEVTLVDSHTKEVVKSGGRVEIVVLEAEVDGVTGEDVKSDRKLVPKIEGSRSTRVESLCLNLKQGTAILPRVNFLHNRDYTKNSNLRLGARFLDNFTGVQVKEAKTGPFLLKDTRITYSNNHPIPSLDDDIWRLENVVKSGDLAKNMKQEGIATVGDFLVHLFRQPQHLREIFKHSNRAQYWERTVKHARKCPTKLRYCSNFNLKTKVIFNVSGEVSGLSQDNCYLSWDELSATQKEHADKMVFSAFNNWEDVEKDQKPNHTTYDHGHHDFLETEPVTPRTFGMSMFLNGLDLDIDETLLCDGRTPIPELLPEPLRLNYNKTYHEFENCISNRWKVLFYVVTFKIRSLPKNGWDDIRAHKKPRFSY